MLDNQQLNYLAWRIIFICAYYFIQTTNDKHDFTNKKTLKKFKYQT
jgi:hypothetical protein